MVRSVKKRPDEKAGTAAFRLREFLDAHPDARWRSTLADVAREIGVSRQMVFRLLPRWIRRRERLQTGRVRAFARTHPKARFSNPNKRLEWPQIAAEIGLPVSTVRRIWSACRLPIEGRRDPEAIKLRRAKRQRQRLATVLRVETCVICGAKFAWKLQQERTQKYYGRSVTCSKSCVQRLRFARSDKR